MGGGVVKLSCVGMLAFEFCDEKEGVRVPLFRVGVKQRIKGFDLKFGEYQSDVGGLKRNWAAGLCNRGWVRGNLYGVLTINC